MCRVRKITLAVVVLYVAGLVWGYLRLPVAALKSLGDAPILTSAPAVSYDVGMNVSPAQRWYLERVFPESAAPVVPIVSVEVEAYWGVVARVRCGHYIGNTGAEGKESLYLCLFGAWVEVYSFGHWMA